MSKRNKPANAAAGKPAADTSPDQQTDPAIGAATPDGQAPAPADGGSGAAMDQGIKEKLDGEHTGENQIESGDGGGSVSDGGADPATDSGFAEADGSEGQIAVDAAQEAEVPGADQEGTRGEQSADENQTEAVKDPDGNAPSGEAPPDPCDVKAPFDPALVAMYAAQQLRCPVPVNPEKWQDEVVAFTELAAFFRAFPDSPDQAGLVQLQRKRIELPVEDRPGELIAMIRLFRCALDQLDRLDREDAARAEAEKPKPEPEAWREPRGFKQTKKAMDPKSGLKVRR
jgi:hypothetical protein